MPRTILIADDHASVRALVQDYLTAQGYRVVAAADGREALMVARAERPDLILLDVMMPNLDGFEFMRVFRRDQATPVILLTARVAETDKVVGLELGADDYVTKPFGMQELVARIRAVLRRVAPESQAAAALRVGDLALDRATHAVTVAGQPVSLTPSEFELLAALMEAPGRVFTREQFLERLQGGEYEGVERTIDVHIRNLRRKIEPDPSRPRYIETVFGVGYRLARAGRVLGCASTSCVGRREAAVETAPRGPAATKPACAGCGRARIWSSTRWVGGGTRAGGFRARERPTGAVSTAGPLTCAPSPEERELPRCPDVLRSRQPCSTTPTINTLRREAPCHTTHRPVEPTPFGRASPPR